MRRKNIKIKQFPLNGARINSVCISKITRKCFITGDSLNNIKFYEFDGEQESFAFNSSSSTSQVQSQVSAVSFNSQDKQIFAGSNRGIIHIWDIEQGKQVNLLKGHSTSINCFGIFPEFSHRMASGSYDTNIKLWDIRDKNNYATLKGHTKQINSIDVSPDSMMLLSGAEDNTCKIWDLRYPQKIIVTYNEHTAPVNKVLFNPDDMMFASASMDKTAKYYRCEPPNHFSFVSSTDMVAMPVTAIAFDDEGKFLYTGANDTLKIWNMAKGGLLIETIESPWKGVSEICWTPTGLLGVAAGNNSLSIWAFDEKQKLVKKLSQKGGDSLVFPNINNKKKDVQKDLMQAMNNINEVMGVVNHLQKQKKEKNEEKQSEMSQEQRQRMRDEEQRRVEQQEQQRVERQRRKDEQAKKDREQRQRIQTSKREQKQRIQTAKREQKQRLQQAKRQEQHRRMQQLQHQRIERERQLQQRIHETFQEIDPLQSSMTNQMLDNSSVVNLSQFVMDGAQKEKLKQIELISGMMKDNSLFETVMKSRMSQLKPVVHFWAQGKIESSLSILKQAEAPIVSDAITAILKSSKLRYGVTPEVAVRLLIILTELMKHRHGTYFRSAMLSINEIVNMFKEELIKIKMFNPMTKNDPAREERLAKYDRLVEEFLNVFKQERLKKYAGGKARVDNQELVDIAQELHKNLEDVLKRLVPRKEP